MHQRTQAYVGAYLSKNLNSPIGLSEAYRVEAREGVACCKHCLL